MPGGQADVKTDSKDNRNLWFLLARATGSPAVGVVREFEGHLGSPDGRGAVGYTTTPLIMFCLSVPWLAWSREFNETLLGPELASRKNKSSNNTEHIIDYLKSRRRRQRT